MEPPSKKRRLTADYDADAELHRKRVKNDQHLKSVFESIFEKYGKDFGGIGDEIDLDSGEIVVDNGHLLLMKDERDPGAIEGSSDSRSEREPLSDHDESILPSFREHGTTTAFPELSGGEPAATASEKVLRFTVRKKNATEEFNGSQTIDEYSDELAYDVPENKTPNIRLDVQNHWTRLDSDPVFQGEEAVDPAWRAPILPATLPRYKPLHRRMVLPVPLSLEEEGHTSDSSQPDRSIWALSIKTRKGKRRRSHDLRGIEQAHPQTQEEGFNDGVRFTKEEDHLLRFFKTSTTMTCKEMEKYFPTRNSISLGARWFRLQAQRKEDQVFKDSPRKEAQPDTAENMAQPEVQTSQATGHPEQILQDTSMQSESRKTKKAKGNQLNALTSIVIQPTKARKNTDNAQPRKRYPSAVSQPVYESDNTTTNAGSRSVPDLVLSTFPGEAHLNDMLSGQFNTISPSPLNHNECPQHPTSESHDSVILKGDGLPLSQLEDSNNLSSRYITSSSSTDQINEIDPLWNKVRSDSKPLAWLRGRTTSSKELPEIAPNKHAPDTMPQSKVQWPIRNPKVRVVIPVAKHLVIPKQNSDAGDDPSDIRNGLESSPFEPLDREKISPCSEPSNSNFSRANSRPVREVADSEGPGLQTRPDDAGLLDSNEHRKTKSMLDHISMPTPNRKQPRKYDDTPEQRRAISTASPDPVSEPLGIKKSIAIHKEVLTNRKKAVNSARADSFSLELVDCSEDELSIPTRTVGTPKARNTDISPLLKPTPLGKSSGARPIRRRLA